MAPCRGDSGGQHGTTVVPEAGASSSAQQSSAQH